MKHKVLLFVFKKECSICFLQSFLFRTNMAEIDVNQGVERSYSFQIKKEASDVYFM